MQAHVVVVNMEMGKNNTFLSESTFHGAGWVQSCGCRCCSILLFLPGQFGVYKAQPGLVWGMALAWPGCSPWPHLVVR